uniref:Arginine--tRNA ligase n=1 Tax=uncultured marine group II/III euryarchaeote SAT1000_33_E05 TaxID=1456575 RepID=A0A075I9H8_9EURY|nr:arginyl-tRNA synthetase (RARS, argS) [uncultured marine group II/III euryarchaeote SAT1000_33_E05]
MLIEHYLENYDAIEDIDLLTFYKEAREKFDNDQSFADRSRERVVLLQSKDPETQDLWVKILDHSMEEFNIIYNKLGVLLEDEEPWGESRYQSHIPIVLERLESIGLMERSEGADVVFPQGWVNREGSPLPMIIRKADGGFNYSATDLACIIFRVEERECDEILYVVGQEQKQHFEMLFKVAREANFMDDSIKAVHIQFGLVLGGDGKKMASRGGVAVNLKGVLDDAVEKAKDAIMAKNPDLEDMDNVAITVGIGAVKYADLSTERTNNYVFDWDKMLSFEGNTSPYLQYAHARICSIFRRSGIERESVRSSSIVLEHESELSLARVISCFSEALDNSIDNYSPHLLCTYLHSLASAFATFYEVCPVLGAEDEATRGSRMAMCDLTARTISTGLGLLGIDSPEQM